MFDAMWNRRCYATTGPHIAMSVTLNGHPMGSVLAAEEFASPPVVQTVVAAPWIIDRVQIVKSGATVADFGATRPAMEAEFHWVDQQFQPDQPAYYYVRLALVDGEMAWSSPIWVTAGVQQG